MKIVTYNVNGLRSALKKGLATWLEAAQPDVLCLQEVKALPEQVDLSPLQALGYEHFYWHNAEQKGYSGVTIFSKVKPRQVVTGMGHPLYDREGRVIRADFDEVSVVSVYVPSGTSGDERQAFKYRYLDDFFNFCQLTAKECPQLVICGDYNICHRPIDIHNPVSNKNSSGFLPPEREWFGQLLASGFTDAFRFFNPEPHHYTWWATRAGARERNLGWRIDYHLVTKATEARLQRCQILPQAVHSDHCPVLLELN
ncbi:MAG: exodeoxyribonuclease III [Bernardetiaceae bacterium]|jgi:exodeoxyribonuclease-3|nr:exodeoxyribonuclease III [Bernardetiaceae bacterium]